MSLDQNKENTQEESLNPKTSLQNGNLKSLNQYNNSPILNDSLSPKWINNNGEAVENVFGFNENAELVNGRAAMFGFIMLIFTEIVFNGEPVTSRIFGIG